MKIIFYAPYNMSENQEFSLDRAPRIRCYNIYKYLRKKCEVVLVCGDAKERKKKYKGNRWILYGKTKLFFKIF